MSDRYDAVVVGSGPNGLAAAVSLAQQGGTVLVLEARDSIGGGTRSAELTLPGFLHDICSAIHPLGCGSPFFRTLPLQDYGLQWLHPPTPLAHPLDDGQAVLLERSLEDTAAALGVDGPAYRRLMAPLVANWERLLPEILAPLHLPRHPFLMAGFGLRAIQSAAGLARRRFREEPARALFAGLAGHGMLPLDRLLSAAIGMVLGAAGHAVGWPLARGGSHQIAKALSAYLRSMGGEIAVGHPVRTLQDIPPSRAILFDLTPRQLLAICGSQLPPRYRRRLERYRYGPGVFKLDLALAGPIPWEAPPCRRAATVHLGGTLAEISAAEQTVWRGEIPEKPFVLLAQQSLFDASRAPENRHTAWAYCHVPSGSTIDMSERIENQIERFAPGFREQILARHAFSAVAMEAYNANYVGGDINGGVQDWRQLFSRPVLRAVPYAVPQQAFFLCSSATPPGGGVHGMCGYHAARAAYRRVLKK